MNAEWKPGRGQKIERLYAWVATEADGGEGVASMLLGRTSFPLIGADMERVASLRPHALAIGRATGAKIELVEFSARRVLT